jgi:hypothetical protein
MPITMHVPARYLILLFSAEMEAARPESVQNSRTEGLASYADLAYLESADRAGPTPVMTITGVRPR